MHLCCVIVIQVFYQCCSSDRHYNSAFRFNNRNICKNSKPKKKSKTKQKQNNKQNEMLRFNFLFYFRQMFVMNIKNVRMQQLSEKNIVSKYLPHSINDFNFTNCVF